MNGGARGGRVSWEDLDLDELPVRVAGPQSIANLAADCSDLLESLGDVTLRLIALWRDEGYTDQEIAERLGCSRVTVQRKLKCIRTILNPTVDSSWAAPGLS